MRRFKGERGTSAVEFALIISLLFIVLFGIIQFGIAYNRYQGLNAAAREGARLGSINNQSVDQIQDRVFQSLSILNQCNFYTTPGNCGSSRRYTCPANLPTEAGCVEVYQAGTASPLQSTAVPCDSSPTSTTVTVVVKYKMRITIPLWASPAITATGTGVFRCETTS